MTFLIMCVSESGSQIDIYIYIYIKSIFVKKVVDQKHVMRGYTIIPFTIKDQMKAITCFTHLDMHVHI